MYSTVHFLQEINVLLCTIYSTVQYDIYNFDYSTLLTNIFIIFFIQYNHIQDKQVLIMPNTKNAKKTPPVASKPTGTAKYRGKKIQKQKQFGNKVFVAETAAGIYVAWAQKAGKPMEQSYLGRFNQKLGVYHKKGEGLTDEEETYRDQLGIDEVYDRRGPNGLPLPASPGNTFAFKIYLHVMRENLVESPTTWVHRIIDELNRIGQEELQFSTTYMFGGEKTHINGNMRGAPLNQYMLTDDAASIMHQLLYKEGNDPFELLHDFGHQFFQSYTYEKAIIGAKKFLELCDLNAEDPENEQKLQEIGYANA